MRLFAGLSIPRAVADGIFLIQAGVPGARWQTREQLHLTLRFIGEVDGRDASAIDDVLSAIAASAFALTLHGAGEFGAKHPHTLWAGVRDAEPLKHLKRKIENAIQRIGLPADERKFTPHVTLARLRGAPRERVIDYIADHALYTSPAFEVTEFILYSSTLTPNGSLYVAERVYPLKQGASP
jgi:2'-5' RNA ligase